MEVGFVKIQINVNIDGLRLKEGNSEQISVGKGPHGLKAAIRKPPWPTLWELPVRANALLSLFISGPHYRGEK